MRAIVFEFLPKFYQKGHLFYDWLIKIREILFNNARLFGIFSLLLYKYIA